VTGRTSSLGASPTEQRQRRGRWVTAAGVVLVFYGGLGIVYAPFLTGGAVWTFLGVGVSTLTILAVLNIATGIGLLRLDGWARLAAGALSSFGLLFLHAPALMAAMANGTWSGIDWLGMVGSFVVLFAILGRWPARLE